MTQPQRLKDTINWIEGIPYELCFWKFSYRYKKRLSSLLEWSKWGKSMQLTGWNALDFLHALPIVNPIILDVGCGMSYATGNLDADGKELNIHYVDALATFFNEHKDKYASFLPSVEFGMMEYLSAFYPHHDVSLIIIQNALDHSANPIKAILEALDALHEGGCLYLHHHPNEAEYEHYRGFHKFNICIEDQRLIIWNKSERYDINAMIKDFARIECSVVDNNPIAVITKTASVPNDLLQSKEDIHLLCSALLGTTKDNLSTHKWVKRHIQYNFYTIIQALIQLFSWQTRQNIKNLYNHLLHNIHHDQH